jgi:hypothetical protein
MRRAVLEDHLQLAGGMRPVAAVTTRVRVLPRQASQDRSSPNQTPAQQAAAAEDPG